ncbi:MAG: Lipid flippase Amj [Chthoniobacteraceae bacterium]|nr:Lipid flippase Amj [Chthoniobacteraceae bacterium]
MDSNLLTICALTFVIHLIGTLAYAARIAGVRTGHIATALTLFNLLIIVSRTSNSFQAPFLAKRIETALSAALSPLLSDFQWILAAAALATALGMFLVPSGQRIFSRAVHILQTRRSLFGLLRHGAHPRRLLLARRYMTLPALGNFRAFRDRGGLSWGFLGLNAFAVALWTVGVFASLYAGALEPNLRVTCSNLSSIINGGATIVMFLLLDPQISLLTDDVTHQRVSQGAFRSAVTSLVGARFVGVLLAQFLLLPSAFLIAYVARHM